MGDDYTERKVRVYEPKVVKSESKLQKYVVNPMKKVAGMDGKSKRLTA
jgi:hypothetical protein